eukprot:775176_1
MVGNSRSILAKCRLKKRFSQVTMPQLRTLNPTMLALFAATVLILLLTVHMLNTLQVPTTNSHHHHSLVDDSCDEWTDLYHTKRRRNLWMDGKVTANVVCDELYAQNRTKEDKALHRSCYFTDNSICYDIKKSEWIFQPRSHIYDNLELLDLNHNAPTSHELFSTAYTINLNFASRSVKSKETPVFWKLKTVAHHTDNASVYYETKPTILGVYTKYECNVGHMLLDSYATILTAFDSWYQCGLRTHTKMNVLLQDNRSSPFDSSIGSALFESIQHINDLHAFSPEYEYICYKHMIVGTTQQEMLNGGLHLKQNILKYLRNTVLRYYNIDPFWKPHSQSDIHMVILIKNTSHWAHENWVKNLGTDVFDWINDEYVNSNKISTLTRINPADGSWSFKQQMAVLSKASIVLCQWGGISFTNMFAVLNSVEIIVTTWDKGMKYTKQAGWNDVIPDKEMPTRDTIATQTTLRYWDKTSSSRIEKLDKTRLLRLMDSALDIVHSNYRIRSPLQPIESQKKKKAKPKKAKPKKAKPKKAKPNSSKMEMDHTPPKPRSKGKSKPMQKSWASILKMDKKSHFQRHHHKLHNHNHK